MWANGPASRSGSALGRAPVDPLFAQVVAAQHGHHVHLGVVVDDQLVHDLGHLFLLGCDGRVVAALAAGRLGVAEPQPGRVQERQVGHRPGMRVLLRSSRTSSGVSQGAHIRRYAGTDHRSPTTSAASSSGHAFVRWERSSVFPLQRPAHLVGGDLVVVVLVDQDAEQLVPDLLARLVVRRPRVRRRERLGHSSALSQMSDQAVSTSTPSVGGSSYSRTAGSIARTISTVDLRRATSGSVSATAVLPSLTRSRTVQVWTPSSPRLGARRPRTPGTPGADRRTARHPAGGRAAGRRTGGRRCGAGRRPSCPSRPSVDDERTAEAGADDGVLVGLDGAEHVAHPGRAAAAQAGDEGRLVVERRVSLRARRA